MKLPSEITVGHQIYTIKPTDEAWLRDSNKYGHCDSMELVIAVVNKGLSDTQIINTLVHEILHALWREYNLPDEYEEHIVTCVANGLCQVLRDNPEVVQLLRKL